MCWCCQATSDGPLRFKRRSETLAWRCTRRSQVGRNLSARQLKRGTGLLLICISPRRTCATNAPRSASYPFAFVRSRAAIQCSRVRVRRLNWLFTVCVRRSWLEQWRTPRPRPASVQASLFQHRVGKSQDLLDALRRRSCRSHARGGADVIFALCLSIQFQDRKSVV